MTRSSPAWLLIAFFIAFVGVGFRYWQLPYAQVSLPDSLYGPGLVAIAVVALMARAFGLARFWKVWLLIAAAVPAACWCALSWKLRPMPPRITCGRSKSRSPPLWGL